MSAFTALLPQDVDDLDLEAAAAGLIASARRQGGIVGVVVDEAALLTLARVLIFENGVQAARSELAMTRMRMRMRRGLRNLEALNFESEER